MKELNSYGKILANGHKELDNLYNGPVVIQEKVDGSQFSFAVFDGELHVRSKGKIMQPDFPEEMFKKAVRNIQSIQEDLTPGWIYRGEMLNKPKHNALAYDRTPAMNVILFDVEKFEDSPGLYLTPKELANEAARLGLESVPIFFKGEITNPTEILQYLDNKSILGGQKIEGVVIKNYGQLSFDFKLCKGKIVSEDFKEVHRKSWGEANPNRGDKLSLITDSLRTVARFNKAIIHLEERGELDNSTRDIGKLLKEINEDIIAEEKEYIKEELYKAFSKDILRGATRGFPEWYKRKLAGIDTETVDWVPPKEEVLEIIEHFSNDVNLVEDDNNNKS